jgi:hypothetical protein
MSPQRDDNLLAVGCPLFFENILANTPSNLPVKHSESGIDRLLHLVAGQSLMV